MSASDYVAGTVSLTNGSAEFTGTDTAWFFAGFREGDMLIDVAGATQFWAVISEITDNTAGTLTRPWEGPTLVDVAYRMRFQPDGARVSAYTRQLLEKLRLVEQNFDAQVNDLAGRAAYDDELGPFGDERGFAILVSDVGDGRAAIYSKNSNTTADWSDPAYFSGPVGPAPVFTVDETTTLTPGAAATFGLTPTVDGYEVDVGIPAGRGITALGDYNPATAYVLDDAVQYDGSSWIALGPTTGNAPPTLPTTSNAYWQLLARQGIDGAGTGDVVGPASSTADGFARFDGTTGKLIKNGAATIAASDIANDAVTNAKLANMATSTIKGRSTAGSGDPEDLTGSQVRAIAGAAVAVTNTAGAIGEWKLVVPAGVDLVMPTGGTWAYFAYRRNLTSGVFETEAVGIAAGGATVAAGVSGSIWRGLVWRIE